MASGAHLRAVSQPKVPNKMKLVQDLSKKFIYLLIDGKNRSEVKIRTFTFN